MAAQRAKVAGTQLLCRYYGLRVMSIHEDRFDERTKTSFDRGRPFSLFKGSTSQIILAHLPTDQPSEFIEVSTQHARKQFEVLSEQTKELAALGQKTMLEAAQPFKAGAARMFQAPFA